MHSCIVPTPAKLLSTHPTIVHGCPPQKYRLYLKRLAGVPLNAPISAEALQRVQEVQQVRQI